MHGFEMPPERRALMAESTALATLDSRETVRNYIAEAEKSGKKREAIHWRAQLKKIEKLIAMYGLERYANRT